MSKGEIFLQVIFMLQLASILVYNRSEVKGIYSITFTTIALIAGTVTANMWAF